MGITKQAVSLYTARPAGKRTAKESWHSKPFPQYSGQRRLERSLGDLVEAAEPLACYVLLADATPLMTDSSLTQRVSVHGLVV
jgi:hypothetical protein